ncbi:MAG: rod shape-determining protein MreC [Muribaculaceae bacterium]|nr:rod shape-determining protein MreC [Muribaculaceae bacterium]
MRNLLNFIIRYSTWFVFTFYVLVSFVLLVSGNSYQQSIFLTSANSATSSIFQTTSNISGYFALKEINESLQKNNAMLENEILNLKSQLAAATSLVADSSHVLSADRFSFVSASVLNNSTSHPRNYFTINRGSDDGLKTGMGVVDHNGIVGIINVTGHKTSRVISLLNESQHFSAKLKNSNFVGTLNWKFGNPDIAYLEELPRHAKFKTGDTIVTSGFSTTFPEGLPVGTVMGRVSGSDNNYYILKVRLASDFRNLGAVRVIVDELKNELDSLTQFDFKIE